ncbi:MAG: hypothetical protein MZU97_02255 [Bacillus subtilis]|nr:hypothetical protein [Bacillus subtilis]
MFESFSVDENATDKETSVEQPIEAVKSGCCQAMYNLPGGSKILIKNQQDIKKGDILAETVTVSEHGGEAKICDDLIIEEVSYDGRTIKKVVNGSEITIIIASITPENAILEKTKKEQLWKVEETGETYIIKSPVDTVVENGMTIAELVDEEYSRIFKR